jgi:DNA-binding response OmpR family regulator
VQRRVLVIEDDRDLARLVRLHLTDLGYSVTTAHDGQEGLAAARSGAHDLIILDLMLPRLDGLDLCRRLRSEAHETPILMLTARSEEVDRVLGLELGADDYMTKPFSTRELMARVRALFRRVERVAAGARDGSDGAPRAVDRGPLHIDPARRVVTLDGEPIDLTPREFDLLLHFARHPGRVYTRRQLLEQVWDYHHDGYEHTVNSHINRLRAKIEKDPAHPRLVLTVWGVGYKFAEPSASGS